MPYDVPIDQAKRDFKEYTFVKRLTASEQKCAFHVKNKEGDDLCLKILNPTCDPARVAREIAAMQSITHPHVARLREYHTPDASSARYFMVEDFVPGEDLTTVLAAAPLSRKAMAKLFSKIFDGLSALQSQGLVHRDLKPSNIRVRGDGTPVIIDFGLVRHLGLPDVTATAEGAAIGTPMFFAPEQFTGTKRDIDSRTDFFAAGVLIYMAMTGNHPFAKVGMGYKQLEAAVCNDASCLTVPGFLKLEQSVRVLTTKLLEKHRINRPADAHTVRDILRKMEV